MPVSRADLVRLGTSLFAGGQSPSDEARIGRAWQLIIGAMATALALFGWTADTTPGDEVVCSIIMNSICVPGAS